MTGEGHFETTAKGQTFNRTGDWFGFFTFALHLTNGVTACFHTTEHARQRHALIERLFIQLTAAAFEHAKVSTRHESIVPTGTNNSAFDLIIFDEAVDEFRKL